MIYKVIFMQLVGMDRDPYFRLIYHGGKVFRVHVEGFFTKKVNISV
jgi:hypothetical protein